MHIHGELQVIRHRGDSSSEIISAVGRVISYPFEIPRCYCPILRYLWFLLEEQPQLIDVYRFQRPGYDVVSVLHIVSRTWAGWHCFFLKSNVLMLGKIELGVAIP